MTALNNQLAEILAIRVAVRERVTERRIETARLTEMEPDGKA
jgi:hypothetical protein